MNVEPAGARAGDVKDIRAERASGRGRADRKRSRARRDAERVRPAPPLLFYRRRVVARVMIDIDS
jgi:hypothetical protein